MNNLEMAQKALERLIPTASRDTGQSRRVADFLLAWWNAPKNGGWDPVDLWNVDGAIADDILPVLHLIRECHCYADKLGFQKQMETIWENWRSTPTISAS